MIVTLNWLKEFVDIEVTAEELASKLLNCGFEVEDIVRQADSMVNLKAGKILSIEKHPNADKLSVCSVDVGEGVVQIVTNAKNVFVGATVPVALDGAVLPDGEKINKGSLRGVESDGMFTGGDTLKITEDDCVGASGEGVLILPEGVAVGTDMAEYFGFDDVIFDISVTANRPDCNSVVGIAREICALTGKSFKAPDITYSESSEKTSDCVAVEVRNQELCPRYMAHSVKNIVIKPSSDKIRRRLKAVGIRPINNVVDITNYVLTEIGQPMHAFDSNYIGGGKIVVRNAIAGEKIVTLDGKVNTLDETMLVIADENKPIAVAGIMGGEFSGINANTSTIVFESAKFARDNIRRTSRSLNLRSDSSARFEKGIDFLSQEIAIKRSLHLIEESGSGVVLGGSVDVKVSYPSSRTLVYPVASLKKILGVNFHSDTVVGILNSLGIPTSVDGKNYVSVIPDVREDIATANDVAEEIIRISGYGRIKSTLLKNCAQTIGGMSPHFQNVCEVKRAMTSGGAHEIVTYSFVSPKGFELLGIPETDSLRCAVKIRNPLGEDVSIMRTTLLPSMLDILAKNINKFNKQGVFFEVAKCYLPKSLPVVELPVERETLVIGEYGGGADFYTVKGLTEKLADAFSENFRYVAHVYPFLHDGRSAEIFSGKRSVGFVGEIHPDVAERLGIDERLYVAEIDLDAVFAEKSGLKSFKPIPKHPPVSRDLAVVVKDYVTADDLINVVKKSADYLESASVFDVYKGAGIRPGEKSVALNMTFRNPERTMKDEEITAEMDKILAALTKKFAAKLR